MKFDRAQREQINAINLSNKAKLYKSQNGQCYLCGKPMLIEPLDHPMVRTLDHITPLALGGTYHFYNLRLAHKWCNADRGIELVSSYIERMRLPEEIFRRERKLMEAISRFMWHFLESERDAAIMLRLDGIFQEIGYGCRG